MTGMSDGTLSVRRRQPKASEASTVDPLRSDVFEFLGTTGPGIGQGAARRKVQHKPTGDVNELRVESKRKKRLRDYDKLLKSFKYSAALDSVLRKVGRHPVTPYDEILTRHVILASTPNNNILTHTRINTPRRTENRVFWTR